MYPILRLQFLILSICWKERYVCMYRARVSKIFAARAKCKTISNGQGHVYIHSDTLH